MRGNLKKSEKNQRRDAKMRRLKERKKSYQDRLRHLTLLPVEHHDEKRDLICPPTNNVHPCPITSHFRNQSFTLATIFITYRYFKIQDYFIIKEIIHIDTSRFKITLSSKKSLYHYFMVEGKPFSRRLILVGQLCA